ncbi:MAG: hypothetical protein AAFX50_01680, partial [Acidobacteriota bacterium]
RFPIAAADRLATAACGELPVQVRVLGLLALAGKRRDHRQPVDRPVGGRFDGDARRAWLDLSADPSSLKELLRPYGGALELTPVSKLVNSPRNDTPRCLDPVQL